MRQQKDHVENLMTDNERVENFFNNHFRMNDDMILDHSAYFEVSHSKPNVKLACYIPSKEYIEKKTGIPEVYQLFQEKINEIKIAFPILITEEYNYLTQIPRKNKGICFLYGNQNDVKNFPKSLFDFVYFYYDNMFKKNIHDLALKNKSIFMNRKTEKYFYVHFNSTNKRRKLDSTKYTNRIDNDLENARIAISNGILQSPDENNRNMYFEIVEGTIEFIKNTIQTHNEKIIYLIFVEVMKDGNEINKDFLSICNIFYKVKNIKIIYCPLMRFIRSDSRYFSDYFFQLPKQKEKKLQVNMTEATRYIHSLIIQEIENMETNKNNPSFLNSMYTKAKSYFSTGELLPENVSVAPFFYRYIDDLFDKNDENFENSIVQLSSYLPRVEDTYQENYEYIAPYINKRQVYKILYMEFIPTSISTICAFFFMYVSGKINEDQTKALITLPEMSGLIREAENVFSPLSRYALDVSRFIQKTIFVDFLGHQNVAKRYDDDLYITVYQEQEPLRIKKVSVTLAGN